MKSLWLLLIVACSYGDPTAGVTFKCDATHGCPDGATCVNGLCSGGHDIVGVACGSGGTCGANAKCCVDFMTAPHCVNATDTCAGVTAACDGAGDCTAPAQCCASAGSAACGSSCQSVACTTPDDCPGAAPNCCFALPQVPWGMCNPTPC